MMTLMMMVVVAAAETTTTTTMVMVMMMRRRRRMETQMKMTAKKSPEVEGVNSSPGDGENACRRVVAAVDVGQHAVKLEDSTRLLHVHQVFGELDSEAHHTVRLCETHHNTGYP